MLLHDSLDIGKIHTLGRSQILQASSQFNTNEHKLKAMLIFILKELSFSWENERKPAGN